MDFILIPDCGVCEQFCKYVQPNLWQETMSNDHVADLGDYLG